MIDPLDPPYRSSEWRQRVHGDSMRVSDLLGESPEHLGAFGEMRVVERPDWRFDESQLDTFFDELHVGELAHFIWRYEQALLNAQCREACKAITDSLAETLGLH